LLIYSFTQPLYSSIFLRRVNRFLIEADLDGEITECHLHDPGRLPDIFSRRRKILIVEKEGDRKTKYDVVAAKVGKEWVFIHSGYHSIFAGKIIEMGLMEKLQGYKIARREYRYGRSRMDFLLAGEKKALLEVKGCTLAKGGVALFPDAPTERGRRHMVELANSVEDGYAAFVLFLVMRNAERFSPNYKVDMKFSLALRRAAKKGVGVLAARIKFDGKNVYYGGEIPVKF